MKTHLRSIQLLAVALASWGLAPVSAQTPAAGTVTGHGAAEIRRQPEFLRVQVEVLAKGKDLKEALARLRARRQAAQKNLELLGMAASAMEFGEPAISTDKNERQRHMAVRMMRMRVQGKKPTDKPKEAPPIIVSSVLKAELPLRSTDPEELLLTAHALEEKMKAADLGGLKELKQASAQDEELAQEQAAEAMDMEDDTPKRGEPVFLYVSKVSDDEKAKALAQAFRKAKRDAAVLAQAAGAELAALHHLENDVSQNSGIDDDGPFETYAYRMNRFLMGRVHTDASTAEQAAEAIGLKPGKVVYRTIVSASFELKKPAADK